MIVARFLFSGCRSFALPSRLRGRAVVVGVAASHPPQGGFALRFHVVGVGADLQKRLCGILHTPDDDRTNVDRITDRIIDLERAALQCLQPTQDLALGIERIDPPKTRPVFSTDVAPEQKTNKALVRLNRDEPQQYGDGEDDCWQRNRGSNKGVAAYVECGVGKPTRNRDQGQANRKHHIAVAGMEFLIDKRAASWRSRNDRGGHDGTSVSYFRIYL